MNIKSILIFTAAATIAAATFTHCGCCCTKSASKCDDGFVQLFDGKTFANWRSRNNPKPPAKGWEIKDGILTVLPKNAGGGGGDIITEKIFSDYILKLDFRLTAKANSGLKYLFNPKQFGGTTLEYQILDPGHPDAKHGRDGNRTVASLYDMLPANPEKLLKPVDEWNEAMLVVKGMLVEPWLNGQKVLEFDRDSDEFKAAFEKSKYKKHTGWGSQTKGHILLQDHNDKVSYRNIRIKEL
jgi:hypothetical protein